MGQITDYAHRTLVNAVKESIEIFDTEPAIQKQVVPMVKELKKYQATLQKLFKECETKTEELKALISEYKKADHNTRLVLRSYRIKTKANNKPLNKH